MSIITRQGDHGTTGLMYNRRVSKCHPRVEACGAVDELNAAIGLARASVPVGQIKDDLLLIQQDLIRVMGELATAVEDLPRYIRDGFPRVGPEMTARVEKLALDLEAREAHPEGWALPGASLGSAALDVARTTCRRAERRVCSLHEAGQLQNPEIIILLNRLSDLLWLFARSLERG